MNILWNYKDDKSIFVTIYSPDPRFIFINVLELFPPNCLWGALTDQRYFKVIQGKVIAMARLSMHRQCWLLPFFFFHKASSMSVGALVWRLYCPTKIAVISGAEFALPKINHIFRFAVQVWCWCVHSSVVDGDLLVCVNKWTLFASWAVAFLVGECFRFHAELFVAYWDVPDRRVLFNRHDDFRISDQRGEIITCIF